MNYNEFINNYIGKAPDYDGNGPQCVDLIKYYLRDVFNIKPQNIGNAEAYFRRYDEIGYLNQNFYKIVNTPDFIPEKRRYSSMGYGSI